MKLRLASAPLALAAVVGVIAVGPPGFDAHAAGSVSKYVFDPTPIAPIGSLGPSATVNVTLTLEDGTGSPVPGGKAFLSFTPTSGGGSASVGSTALTTTPTSFQANGSGNIAITYSTPATLPSGGTDTLKAQNKATMANFNQSDIYRYRAPALHRYKWSPYPIARPASLTSGQTVSLTVTAQTSSGSGLGGVTIYLAKNGALSLGSASVGATTLTKTPHAFTANGSGQVAVTFKASQSATLPTTGTFTIIAQNAATAPTVSATDSYSYGVPKTYTFTPKPIAARGSLAGGSTVVVTLIVKDASLHSVAGARVDLLFHPAPGGGSATVDDKVLGATAIGFITDSKGRILITYHTAASPPATGKDTILAENTTTSPTITAKDSYTY
jgi:hypothetical protein